MPVQFPVDKLTLCNSALSQTGDNSVNALDDGSDEFNCCSPAYERALAWMLEEHGWVQATKVVNSLPKSAVPPTDNLWYDSAYNLPQDLLHLIWVRQNGMAPPYDILSNQIILRTGGVGSNVSIKYVSTDLSEVTSGTPMFVVALETFVISAIYRGLHEDAAEADKIFGQAERMAQRARTRSDQQKPKQQLWNSRISMSRRVRRPWIVLPPGWSGTGNPW